MSEELTLMREQIDMLPTHMRNSMMWNPLLLQRANTMARIYLDSGMLPDGLKIPGVLVGLDIAARTGRDPLSVLQSIYFVKGKAGWSSSYLIALAKEAGYPLRWRVVDGPDGLEVTCFTDAIEGDSAYATVSMKMAEDEGWTSNPKYQTMPELMLRYRSATMFVRLYLPEIILGLGGPTHTVDELEDIVNAQDVTAERVTPPPTPAGYAAQIDALLGGEPSTSQPSEAPSPGPSPPENSGSSPAGPTEPESIGAETTSEDPTVEGIDPEAAATATDDDDLDEQRLVLLKRLREERLAHTDEQWRAVREGCGVLRLQENSPLERVETLLQSAQAARQAREQAAVGDGDLL